MCGIAGIYNFGGRKEEHSGSSIRRMTDAMSHRGPDASGFYEDPEIALGHRRLSIIDLSPAGNQPYTSGNGRYKMVFNGELYNFQSVRALITDHRFKSTGDTEVLMEGWVLWGIGVVEKLKGMFSFAVWDTQEKELVICRDRLGVKPLYYYQDEHQFVFASELRSVVAGAGIRPKLSTNALMSFLTYQSVAGNQSIFEGIKELEAGHFMKVRNGQVEIKKYWDITSNPGLYQGEGLPEVKHKIRGLLRTAVEQRLVSDVPVGAFLSGGIDSSAVVGLMAEVSASRPETFNVCFEEEEFDESRYAEIVAKKFNTNHHRILLKPEAMLENLIPALNAMDTPSADGINSYVVSKAIREAGITVALSGIGGDELFAGYPFFGQYKSVRKFKNIWPAMYPFRKLAAALLAGESTKKQRLRQLCQIGNCSVEELYPLFRQILPPSRISRLMGHPFVGDVIEQKLSALPALGKFPDYSQISIADYLGYTQYTLLKDTDQMSMAVSLEVREPFFDHELISYVLQVPDELKTPVYPKKLLVESLGDLLPHEVVHRKKQGFVFPWAQWMRKELKDFCTERINSISERSFMDAGALQQEWAKFLKGDPSVRWAEIWIFIILEQWLQNNECE